MAPPLCSTSEVNLLVYHYLKESGYLHTCFNLRNEARLDDEPLSREAVVPPGKLVKVLQAGLLYEQVDAHVGPDGTERACSAPFQLVGPPHVCDGKSRKRPSPMPTPLRLTPEPQPRAVPTTVEAAAQTDDSAWNRVVEAAQHAEKEKRLNGHHPIASSSKSKLTASEDPEDVATKRKASVGASSGSRDEKRLRREASETRPIPNGIHKSRSATEEVSTTEQDEEIDVEKTKTSVTILRNGKSAIGNAKAKGKKGAVVEAVSTKSGKKAKGSKKKRKDEEAEDEDEDAEQTAAAAEAEAEAIEEAEAPPPKQTGGKKSAAASKPPASLPPSAKGKEVAVEDMIQLTGHTAEVFSSAWNPTVPGLLASAGGDATVRIWDLPTKGSTPDPPAVCKHLPMMHAKDVSGLHWNPDGTLLASVSYDGILRLWTPQGDLHLVMSMHQGPIFSVRWNRKGTMLLTCSADGTAIVWDLSSGKVRQQFPIHSDSVLDADWLVSTRAVGPASSRNEVTFATCSADNSIHICRVGEAKPIRTLRGHDDEVNAIRFDHSQTLLASASDDLTARIWTIDSNTLTGASTDSSGRPKRGSAPVSKGRGSSAALDAAASTSMDLDRSDDDADVSASDLRSTSSSGAGNGRASPFCKFTLKGHTKELYALEWAPSGPGSANPDLARMLATSSFDHTARIWNGDDGSCIRVISEHTELVYTVSWSPDAAFLATGGGDHRAFVHRVSDGSLVKAHGGTGSIFDIAWHESLPAKGEDEENGTEGTVAAPVAGRRGHGGGKRANAAAAATTAAAKAAANGSTADHVRTQLSLSQGSRTVTILDLGDMSKFKTASSAPSASSSANAPDSASSVAAAVASEGVASAVVPEQVSTTTTETAVKQEQSDAASEIGKQGGADEAESGQGDHATSKMEE